MTRPLWILLTAALVAGGLSTACGGGGGGGGGGTAPPPPTTPTGGIELTTGNATAPAVRLARGAGSSDSVLELEIRADGLTGVYGVAFDLAFPDAVLDFEGSTEGGFLSGAAGNGAATTVQVAQAASGRLVVGLSRLGDVPGVDGSGVLLTLRFSADGAGSGSLRFDANRVLDAEGREIPGISWAGGTVDVTL